MIQSSMRILATAYAPRVADAALSAEVHAAAVEEDEPCSRRIARQLRRRPIEGRLHIGKRTVRGIQRSALA